jgi:hypothetical protein
LGVSWGYLGEYPPDSLRHPLDSPSSWPAYSQTSNKKNHETEAKRPPQQMFWGILGEDICGRQQRMTTAGDPSGRPQPATASWIQDPWTHRETTAEDHSVPLLSGSRTHGLNGTPRRKTTAEAYSGRSQRETTSADHSGRPHMDTTACRRFRNLGPVVSLKRKLKKPIEQAVCEELRTTQFVPSNKNWSRSLGSV